MTVKPDLWESLRSLTHARIALGRAGHAVPTKELLDFRLAHSQARDSVWLEVDFSSLRQNLGASGLETIVVESQCSDKQNFLLNPHLGRHLKQESKQALCDSAKTTDRVDCAMIVADGLSAKAVHTNAAHFVQHFVSHLKRAGLTLAPIVLARYGRVAIGDEIALALKARSVLIVIGERPGLASSESIGVYFTYDPREGCKDHERNCISNIHSAGILPETAAYMASYLAKQAIIRQLSGVDLKVEYPALVTAPMI